VTSRLHQPSDTYGSGLVTICLLFTVVAFNHDKDNGWLIIVAAVAGVAIAALPGALTTARAIRQAPHAHRIAASLLGLAILAGLVRMNLATLAGVLGAVILIYVMGLGVVRFVSARWSNGSSGPPMNTSG
jgi:uncharacterized membrane protein